MTLQCVNQVNERAEWRGRFMAQPSQLEPTDRSAHSTHSLCLTKLQGTAGHAYLLLPHSYTSNNGVAFVRLFVIAVETAILSLVSAL